MGISSAPNTSHPVSTRAGRKTPAHATLTLRTGCRLSLGLIDMNGELGRVDGSLGLALSDPGFEIRARRARGLRITSPAPVADSTREKIEALFSRFEQNYPVAGIDIEILRDIPRHFGLGSGTQLAMAVGRALDLLYSLGLSNAQLATLVGRGGTGGIGVEAFRAGGFIVDGGHRFGGADGKKAFAPSAASKGFFPPPILFRAALPPHWRVVLVLPAGRLVHGEEERALFEKFCPVPRSEVADIAHLTLFKVLPALLEADLDSFGAGLEAVQRLGFKRREIGQQNEVVHDTLAEMRRLGLRGVGMTSWGPAIFGFSDAGDEADRNAARALEHFGAGRGGTQVIVTSPAEAGASWRWSTS